MLLQQGGVFACSLYVFSPVTCLSLVIWISSHSMLDRAQMSHVQKKEPHAQTVALSLWNGRTCSKMRWAMLSIGKTRKLSNLTKSQAFAWMIINPSWKKPNLLEARQKFAHQLSSNACIQHELDGLASCRQSTNLLERSQNGQELLSNAWLVWCPTLITKVISDTLSSGKHGASLQSWSVPRLRLCWRSWKLKISSRGVLCYLGSRTFLSVSWMCKKQKFCLAQLHGVWDHCSRCWWVTCSTNNNVQPKQTSHQETGGSSWFQNWDPTCQKKIEGWSRDQVPTDTHSSQGESQLYIFEKLWSKWWLRDEVWRWDMCPNSHRVAIDWLLDRVNLEPQIQTK